MNNQKAPSSRLKSLTHLGWILLIIFSLAIAGCKNPAHELVGKWTLKMDQSADASNPGLGKAFANMASSMMTLEIKADKTWSMGGGLTSGTYTLSGDTVTFHSDKVFGIAVPTADQSANSNMTATLSSDGKSLSVKKEGKNMSFTKEKE